MKDEMQERDKYWAKCRISNNKLLSPKGSFYLFIYFFYTEQKHRLFSKPAAYVVIAGDR